MAKTSPDSGKSTFDAQLATAVGESAEQIWLAGLGAFAKAQQEGGKFFDALVREGDLLQQRTRAATEQRLEEVAERMTEAATQLSQHASSSWDRLEQVFEDRVARALSHLGVPSARDIRELTDMLQALNHRIAEMDMTPASPARSPGAKRPRAPAGTAGVAKDKAPHKSPQEPAQKKVPAATGPTPLAAPAPAATGRRSRAKS
jgi:poly(hydroxyalkanoate) granule-associated protein